MHQGYAHFSCEKKRWNAGVQSSTHKAMILRDMWLSVRSNREDLWVVVHLNVHLSWLSQKPETEEEGVGKTPIKSWLWRSQMWNLLFFKNFNRLQCGRPAKQLIFQVRGHRYSQCFSTLHSYIHEERTCVFSDPHFAFLSKPGHSHLTFGFYIYLLSCPNFEKSTSMLICEGSGVYIARWHKQAISQGDEAALQIIKNTAH